MLALILCIMFFVLLVRPVGDGDEREARAIIGLVLGFLTLAGLALSLRSFSRLLEAALRHRARAKAVDLDDKHP